MKDEASSSQATFVRHLGEGERKVLALHCTIAHSRAWAGLAAALKDEATLIAPDMLFHGQSPDWDGEGDVFEAVTRQALDQLTEPLDVIGHSFGGMIALRLAIEYPELVRSAVLIEPVFFAVVKQDAPHLVQDHDREAQPYLTALAAKDNRLAARLFNRMWTLDDGPRWPDLPERTRAAMERGIQLVAPVEDVLFDDRLGLLKAGQLDRATMPVLLLRGSRTQPTIQVINTGLQNRLPSASDRVIDGAGHMLPISHPHETAEQILRFWGAKENARSE
ncbi:alpha/beta fold hydrolase [Roseibium sp. RKSG952]|uniref:alpha/beta fold hydrolase n=1 Tax=Roseibium sp. RKSG952 TaxID=2529384 RepID=UPI0013C7BA7A|nr:alpha/beta hydrolase [Roseibium sp. RKSG952]